MCGSRPSRRSWYLGVGSPSRESRSRAERFRRDDRWVEGDDEEYEGPLDYVFGVGDRPYCYWAFDHEARTSEFLDGVDTDYFGTIASVFADRLESDDRLPVSVALCVSYHQGLETLMSLLAARLRPLLRSPRGSLPARQMI